MADIQGLDDRLDEGNRGLQVSSKVRSSHLDAIRHQLEASATTGPGSPPAPVRPAWRSRPVLAGLLVLIGSVGLAAAITVPDDGLGGAGGLLGETVPFVGGPDPLSPEQAAAAAEEGSAAPVPERPADEESTAPMGRAGPDPVPGPSSGSASGDSDGDPGRASTTGPTTSTDQGSITTASAGQATPVSSTTSSTTVATTSASQPVSTTRPPTTASTSNPASTNPATTTSLPPTTTTTATTVGLPALHLMNRGTGDTSSAATLPLAAGSPASGSLPNYDTDRDDAPGLLLAKDGAGLSTSDRTKRQDWSHTLDQAATLDGTVTLTVWIAAKDKKNDETIGVRAALELCSPICRQIGVGQWSGAGRSVYRAVEVDLGDLDLVAPAGSSLRLRIVVPDSLATTDLWLAYGTGHYSSRLSID